MKFQNAIPWGALIVSIIITLTIWIGYYNFNTESKYEQFRESSHDLIIIVEKRMDSYGQLLYGAKAFVESSDEVRLDEWMHFIKIQNTQQRFPGIQGTGYITYVNGQQEHDNLIKKMQQYGIDDYTIHPEGIRNEYYAITFLEPLDFRNQRAVGYDVYSESMRRSAVDLAINTNEITLTRKIILVQETDTGVQNGFLMLLPVYSSDNKLDGLVYTVFRMNDFMLGIFGTNAFSDIHMKIYDGKKSSENLFFNSGELENFSAEEFEYNTEFVKTFGQQQWIFSFFGNTTYDSIYNVMMILIPVTGFGMSILLFFTLNFLNSNLRLSQEATKSAKFAVIGELASRLAHDLRNPLTALKVSVQLIRTSEETADSNRRHLKVMDDSIARMNHQISNVLDFVKKNPLIMEKNKIKNIIYAAEDELEIPSDVKIEINGDNYDIICDFAFMKTVFTNLIFNAIQAMEKKGTITINLSQDEKKYTFSVSDSGPGMTDEVKEQLFEPLFTTKQEGTGLGLSSVKTIVEQHNGTITVSQKPTTFTINIPRTTQSV